MPGARFKSCLTQSASYVLACYRYIELNPVRAGMVTRPGDYRWSSFLANAHGKSNQLLTPHEEFLRLGATAEARRAAYQALIAHRLEPETVATIRSSTNGNVALGSLTFQAEVEAMLGRRARPGRPGRPYRERRADVADQAVPQAE